MEMQGLTPRFWLAVSWVALRNLNALQAPQDSKTPALTWWFSALEAYFINKHFMNEVNPDVTPKDSPLVGLVRGSTSAFFFYCRPNHLKCTIFILFQWTEQSCPLSGYCCEVALIPFLLTNLKLSLYWALTFPQPLAITLLLSVSMT